MPLFSQIEGLFWVTDIGGKEFTVTALVAVASTQPPVPVMV